MPGPRTRRRPRVQALPAALVVTATILIATGGLLYARLGSGTPCDVSAIGLTVDAAPDVAASLTSLADSYSRGGSSVDGRCVTVDVRTTDPATTTAALARGWDADTDGPTPDVWVPDSATWTNRAAATQEGAATVDTGAPSIAATPLVVAMPRPMAAALGWPARQPSWSDLTRLESDPRGWGSAGHPEWGAFRLAAADPTRSVAALQAVISVSAAAVRTAPAALTPNRFLTDRGLQLGMLTFERRLATLVGTDAALMTRVRSADRSGQVLRAVSAFPATEQSIWRYDNPAGGARPRMPLAAVYPTGGTTSADHPYVVLGATAPAHRAAAADFLRYLRGGGARAALTAAGFRVPGTAGPFTAGKGVPAAVPGAAAAPVPVATQQAAATVWTRIHQRSTTLTVLDVSGSMGDLVPGTNETKLSIIQSAALTALPLFADDSQVGLWEFATRLDGDRDYRQLVPVGPIAGPYGTGTRRQAGVAAIRALRPTTNTGLYDTALAAYTVKAGQYVPGRLNLVVLLTDGRNDDPGSIDLPALLARLKALYDPRKPVRLITIAYSTDADESALRQMSAATGGQSYVSQDPRSILDVFVTALTSN